MGVGGRVDLQASRWNIPLGFFFPSGRRRVVPDLEYCLTFFDLLNVQLPLAKCYGFGMFWGSSPELEVSLLGLPFRH